METPRDSFNVRNGIGILLLSVATVAGVLFALLARPLPPLIWQGIRPGILGMVLPVALAFAAFSGVLPPRTPGKRLWGHFLFLGLVATPMTVGQDYTVPLAWTFRWFLLTGSGLGAWAWFVLLGATLLVLVGLLVVDKSVSRIVSRVLLGFVIVVTAVDPLLHWAWFGFGGAVALGSLATLVAGGGLALWVLWVPWRWVRDDESARFPLPQWLPEASVLVVASIVYLAVKGETLSYSATDENVYFYAILSVVRGEVPYRDFFFAHPPLHLLLPALLVKLFGGGFVLLKSLSAVFSLFSGWFLYAAVRRRGGIVAGILSTLFFWFAMEQLQASTNLTGINLTVMFVAAAFALAVSGRGLWSGVAGGAAVLTGVYAVGPILGLLPALALVGRRDVWRFLLGFVGVALGGHLLFGWLFGDAYFSQVFLYHFLKPAAEAGFVSPGWIDLVALALLGLGLVAFADAVRVASLRRDVGARAVPMAVGLGLVVGGVVLTYWTHGMSGSAGSALGAGNVLSGIALFYHDFDLFIEGKEYLRFAFFHDHLVWAPVALLAVAGGALVLRNRTLRPDGILMLAGLGLALAAVAELALLQETFTFYFVLVIPGCAVALGLFWGTLARWVGNLHDEPFWRNGVAGRIVVIGVLLVCAWVGTGFVPRTLAIGKERFPEESTQVASLRCYDIKDNVESPFSGFVQQVFLDSCRLQGSSEPGIYHALWKKKWFLSVAPEVARYVAEHSRPQETLVGSSLVAPLVALLADRRIAAGYVDTNAKRFKAGMTADADAWLAVQKRFPDWSELRCKVLAVEMEMWDRVCRTPIRFVVAGPNSYFSGKSMSRHPVIRRYFKPVQVFNDTEMNLNGKYPIVLFERVAEEPDSQGYYCRFPNQL